VNAGSPHNAGTPLTEDAIIAAVEREAWRSSHDFGRNWDCLSNVVPDEW
jgi:hypothetical protein